MIYLYILIVTVTVTFANGFQSILPNLQSKIPKFLQYSNGVLSNLYDIGDGIGAGINSIKLPTGPMATKPTKYLYFTGAGIYFWWQVNNV